MRKKPATSVLFVLLAMSAFLPLEMPNGMAGTGPFGGIVWSIVVDPMEPDTVYAGSFGGAFKSGDAGATWLSINTGLPSRLVRSLTMDPNDSTLLFLGLNASPGAFKSTTAGDSWSATDGLRSTVNAFAIDATDSITVYAAASVAGVFKSVDGGSHWENIGITNFFVTSLAMPQDSPSPVYAATLFNGIYKTVDQGGRWTRTSFPVIATDAITLDPQDADVIYASTGTGIYQSTNGGDGWNLIGPPARHVAVDQQDSNTLYAGRTFDGVGVVKSTDGGKTWNPAGGLEKHVRTLTVDPVNSNIIYAGTDEGNIFKSEDAGDHWEALGTAFWP